MGPLRHDSKAGPGRERLAMNVMGHQRFIPLQLPVVASFFLPDAFRSAVAPVANVTPIFEEKPYRLGSPAAARDFRRQRRCRWHGGGTFWEFCEGTRRSWGLRSAIPQYLLRNHRIFRPHFPAREGMHLLRPAWFKKAPRVGLEPTTFRLTAGCSTIELPRNFHLS
jgi:hypothetical protein